MSPKSVEVWNSLPTAGASVQYWHGLRNNRTYGHHFCGIVLRDILFRVSPSDPPVLHRQLPNRRVILLESNASYIYWLDHTATDCCWSLSSEKIIGCWLHLSLHLGDNFLHQVAYTANVRSVGVQPADVEDRSD